MRRGCRFAFRFRATFVCIRSRRGEKEEDEEKEERQKQQAMDEEQYQQQNSLKRALETGKNVTENETAYGIGIGSGTGIGIGTVFAQRISGPLSSVVVVAIKVATLLPGSVCHCCVCDFSHFAGERQESCRYAYPQDTIVVHCSGGEHASVALFI